MCLALLHSIQSARAKVAELQKTRYSYLGKKFETTIDIANETAYIKSCNTDIEVNAPKPAVEASMSDGQSIPNQHQ